MTDVSRAPHRLPAAAPRAGAARAVPARGAARGRGGGGARRPPTGADRTDLPFVTIDPPTSRDLDQAVHLARRGDGYRVHYAIADVAAFVRPGGALEAETWRRGQTVYLPDGKVPLHPTVLSEGAASLLPDVDRAAVLWTIDLDAAGDTVDVRRASGRGCAAGPSSTTPACRPTSTPAPPPEPIALLPEIGALLVARGLRPRRDQPAAAGAGDRAATTTAGGWCCARRLPVEEYNAQISLLTGMAAAAAHARRRGRAAAHDAARRGRTRSTGCGRPPARCGIDWPDGDAGRARSSPRSTRPTRAAPRSSTRPPSCMRGAGYTAFDGAAPEQPAHGARRRPVRPRDGAAAPPGRPVRHRGVPGPVRRRAGARRGRAPRCPGCRR